MMKLFAKRFVYWLCVKKLSKVYRVTIGIGTRGNKIGIIQLSAIFEKVSLENLIHENY